MIIDRYPQEDSWKNILQRPALNVSGLYDNVQAILDRVKAEGDNALYEYGKMFDKVSLESLSVSDKELKDAANNIPTELKEAIESAAENIRKFHSSQKQEFRKIETTTGVTCWQKAVAITSVGLYIPGGSAPLFSTVLMLAIPAKPNAARPYLY